VLNVGATEAMPMGEFKKDEDFWEALKAGACWTAEAPKQPPTASRLIPAATTVEMLLAKPAEDPPRTPGWRPAGVSPLIAAGECPTGRR
jgi:hypothetical protein